MNDTTPAPAPPATETLSLVQRIAALEDSMTRIYGMLARDREYWNELCARIGLTL